MTAAAFPAASGPVASGTVVLSNLIYLVGAIVLMIVITAVIVMRQRKPKSLEANVESFNRGLRALAPDAPPSGKRPAAAATSRAEAARRIEARRAAAGDKPQPDSSTETGTG